VIRYFFNSRTITYISDPDSIKLVNPDPEFGPGSRRAKMTQKIETKLRNFIFSSGGCSLLRAEGFSAWTTL
jgi:hypothetical protein